MREAADELESALGHEVRVRPARARRSRVEIRFDDLDEVSSSPASSPERR